MNILVIKDNKPGHYNQSEGLVLSLREIYKNINVEYVQAEITTSLRREILRRFLNFFPFLFKKEFSKKFIPFFYKKFSFPQKKPDIIISTGGNCSNLNVWFKYLYNAKNILNGNLRGLKCFHFDIVTTVIDLGCKNQIILDVAPTTVRFCNQKEENLYALLIGGNGSGYIYDKNFFVNLANFVKNVSKKENIKWLITTSRRTKIEYEEFLYEELKDYSEEFVAYNKNPKPVVKEFLCKSKKVFVTEESASMISEAIASKKQVYTLKPKIVKYDKKYTPVLEKFEKDKKICRIDMDNPKMCETFNLIEDEVYKLIAQKLKAVLRGKNDL